MHHTITTGQLHTERHVVRTLDLSMVTFFAVLHSALQILLYRFQLRALELRTEKAIVRKWHAISGIIIQYGGPASRDGRMAPSGQYIERIRLSSASESLADELELTMRPKRHRFSKILKVKFFLSNAIFFSVLGSRVRSFSVSTCCSLEISNCV